MNFATQPNLDQVVMDVILFFFFLDIVYCCRH